MYEEGKSYKVTYINKDGKEVEDIFIPESNISIAGIINYFKDNKKDFFKLVKVEEDMKEEKEESKLIEDETELNLIDQIKLSGKGLYDFVANNYYKLDVNDLKEIALNAIYVANNDEQILAEIKDRLFEEYSDADKNIDYSSLEKEMEQEVYDYLLYERGFDLKEDIANNKDFIEGCLEQFQSDIIVNYMNNNKVDLLFDYEFDDDSKYGIKINVWEA